MGRDEEMRPLVEFCINNLTPDVQAVKQKLENDYSIDVIDYGCLGYCGICARQPYALVNGEVVRGKNAADLYKKIYQAIEAYKYQY